MDKIQCLNEAQEGSGKTVFKPWDERLDRSKVVKLVDKSNQRNLLVIHESSCGIILDL